MSYDGIVPNRAFAEKYGFPFKLLCDVDHAVGLAYGAHDASDPDYPARISYLIGPDRKIVKAYAMVTPAEHAAQVLADLPR